MSKGNPPPRKSTRERVKKLERSIDAVFQDLPEHLVGWAYGRIDAHLREAARKAAPPGVRAAIAEDTADDLRGSSLCTSPLVSDYERWDADRCRERDEYIAKLQRLGLVQ